MSQDRLVDAVSLSTTCEPDVFDGNDCFQLGLQILGVLRDASSGIPRDIIQQLFCSRQITRLYTLFSSRRASNRCSFFWHLPISGSFARIECLNSCLRMTYRVVQKSVRYLWFSSILNRMNSFYALYDT
jgi:hypothetical protein